MPRFHRSDLGKAYDMKFAGKNAVKGYIVQMGEQMRSLEPCKERYVKTMWVEDFSKAAELMQIDGSLSLSWAMIEGSGAGNFEVDKDRSSKTCTFLQVGYQVEKVLLLKKTTLTEAHAYKDSRYLHEQLRDLSTLEPYLDAQGRHVLTKLYLGCKAQRKITIHCESARDRKKIEASVKGSLNLGLFKIQFQARFSSEDTNMSEHQRITTVADNIGGDGNLFNVKLDKAKIMSSVLGEEVDDSWNKFFESASKDENLAVVRAEAEPVRSDIVRLLGLKPEELATYNERVMEARKRKEDVIKQRVLLGRRVVEFKSHASAFGLDPGAANKMTRPFETLTNAFIENHLTPLRDALSEYLMQHTHQIINGPLPPRGGKNVTKFDYDFQDIDDISEIKGGVGILSETQMNEMFSLLTEGERRRIAVDDGHFALWDGVFVAGKPYGMPNAILFFHSDVDLAGLEKEEDWVKQNRLWRLKVRGADWDVGKSAPVNDQETFIEANLQEDANPASVLDFSKLPGYLGNIAYTGKRTYASNVAYVGDWMRGKWHGPGGFVNLGGQGATGRFNTAFGDFQNNNPHGEFQLTWAMGDGRANYKGSVCLEQKDTAVFDILPHGKGTLTFSDGDALTCSWHRGRAVVNTKEDVPGLVKHAWINENVDQRLHFPVMEQLRDGLNELMRAKYELRQGSSGKEPSAKRRMLHKQDHLSSALVTADEFLGLLPNLVMLRELRTRVAEDKLSLEEGRFLFTNIIMLGNPGSGKSTILNGLTKKETDGVLFSSGTSIGMGKTRALQQEFVDGVVYIDAPGLADINMRKLAAKEITEGLKQEGNYKIFFVITLESGRLRGQDKMMLKNILDAMKGEVNAGEFRLIINKLEPKVRETLQYTIKGEDGKTSLDRLLESLFTKWSENDGEGEGSPLALPMPDLPVFLGPFESELSDKTDGAMISRELRDFIARTAGKVVHAASVSPIKVLTDEEIAASDAKISELAKQNEELERAAERAAERHRRKMLEEKLRAEEEAKKYERRLQELREKRDADAREVREAMSRSANECVCCHRQRRGGSKFCCGHCCGFNQCQFHSGGKRCSNPINPDKGHPANLRCAFHR